MKASRTMLVGLTGSSGSGQSTAAALFNSNSTFVRGVCSFDEVGHRLLEKRRIRKAVGSVIAMDHLEEMTGIQARNLLGSIVFDDDRAMAALSSVVHPLMKRWASYSACVLGYRQGTGIVILEGSLLYELGIDSIADTMIVLACERATSISRIMVRDGLSAEKAAKRLGSQMPLTEKINRADWVIYNGSGSTPGMLAGQVEEILRHISCMS